MPVSRFGVFQRLFLSVMISILANTAVNAQNAIYIGTNGGVYKTVDEGDIWTKTNYPNTLVRIVQAAPGNPDILYAGTDDGIHKSEDGGSSWTHKGLSGARINAIAIDPVNPGTVYVGTGIEYISIDTAYIFKSTDGGDHWDVSYLLTSPVEAVLALLIDVDSCNYVYAGISVRQGISEGLLKSTDGGTSWVSRVVSSNNRLVSLAMTSTLADPRVIYTLNTDAFQSDVYKSTDRGESWTRTYIPSINGYALAVDPLNPQVVYAGKYKSADNGSTWSLKESGLPPVFPKSMVIDPRNSDLYVGLSGGGVYKSTDGADNWNGTELNNAYVVSMAVHPTSPDTAFAAIKGTHHLAKTTNGGVTWNYLENSGTNHGAVTIDPSHPSIIYNGFGWARRTNVVYSLRKSIDGGQNWTSTGYMFSTIGSYELGVSDIWVNPLDSSTILVGVAGFGDAESPGGVHKSTDGGETWERTLAFWTTALAADPNDPDTMYCGTARNGYVFQSTDAGSTWTSISPDGEWVGEVRDIEVVSNSQVYAATDEGLMEWDSFAWTKLSRLPTDNITACAIDTSTNPQVLYACTSEYGIYISQDGGNTWSPINEGLGNLAVSEFAVSPAEPKMLYAGTAYGGVWNRPAAEPTTLWTCGGPYGGSVNNITMALAKPNIMVTPDSLFFSVSENGSGSKVLTISNMALPGSQNLSWDIAEYEVTLALSDDRELPIGLGATNTFAQVPENKRAYRLGNRQPSDYGGFLGRERPPSISPPIDPPTEASPTEAETDIALVLDDGSREIALRSEDGGQFIWLNRFTPAPGDFPFTLDEIWILFGADLGVNVGDLLDIYVYEDIDGDGDPGTGAACVASYHNAAVQAVDDLAFSVYTIPPVVLNGPNDVLIAVVNRTPDLDPDVYPAALDESLSAGRSWAGVYLDGVPGDPPVLPADNVWGVMDDFGFPGNWMIRGYGYLGTECTWLAEIPANGTIAAGEGRDVDVVVEATGLAPGTYKCDLRIDHSDPDENPVVIPVTLVIGGCDCTGFCDFNFDSMFNPVDVVIMVNYVYLNNDIRPEITTCYAENGDWNCDDIVNPVDVVYIVNYVYKNSNICPCDPCADDPQPQECPSEP